MGGVHCFKFDVYFRDLNISGVMRCGGVKSFEDRKSIDRNILKPCRGEGRFAMLEMCLKGEDVIVFKFEGGGVNVFSDR